jgi:hypothetical protein
MGGKNLPPDVEIVQSLLNNVPPTEGGPARPLRVSGGCGQDTIDAIQRFQLHHFGWSGADGRVDPDHQTLAKLNEYDRPVVPPSPPKPTSRNFRIREMLTEREGPVPVGKRDFRSIQIIDRDNNVYCEYKTYYTFWEFGTWRDRQMFNYKLVSVTPSCPFTIDSPLPCDAFGTKVWKACQYQLLTGGRQRVILYLPIKGQTPRLLVWQGFYFGPGQGYGSQTGETEMEPTGEGIKPYRGPEFEQLSEAARKHTPSVHSW